MTVQRELPRHRAWKTEIALNRCRQVWQGQHPHGSRALHGDVVHLRLWLAWPGSNRIWPFRSCQLPVHMEWANDSAGATPPGGPDPATEVGSGRRDGTRSPRGLRPPEVDRHDPGRGSGFRPDARGVGVDARNASCREGVGGECAPLGWPAGPPRRLAYMMQSAVCCYRVGCEESLRETAIGRSGEHA